MLKKILAFIFLLLSVTTFPQKQIDTLLEKGIKLYSKGEYVKAIEIFKTCVTLVEKNDKKNQSNIYNNLGNAYSQTGNSIFALDNYQKAVKIAEQVNDKSRVAKTNLNIGSLYSEQGDFKNALFYFDKSEKTGKEINDASIIADCLNNKGIIYEQQNKYEDALLYYTRALELYRQQKKNERIALTLNNLGIVYKYLKQFSKSIDCYNQSIKLSELLGDQFLVSANLNNVGNVYALKGDFRKALELYFQSTEIAKRINATNILIGAYEGISSAYFSLKQYQKAYEFRKKYDEEKSEFINTERSRQLAEIQTKYETEKKENQIKLLKQNNYINTLEIKEQNSDIKKRNIFIGLTFVIFVLIGVALYFQNQRQKLKNQIEKENAVKEMEEIERIRIAKDIHDELGSGLTKIALVAEYSKQHINENKNLADNIQSISKTSKELVENMRDMVWALNPENTTLDDLVSRIREYSSEYLEELSFKYNLDFPLDIPAIKISKETQRNIFLTFKEAINNSVKYSEASEFGISVKLDGNHLNITVNDNGIGFEKQDIKKTGNGLRNMKQRIEAIGGLLTIDSGNGTIVNININLQKIEEGSKLLL